MVLNNGFVSAGKSLNFQGLCIMEGPIQPLSVKYSSVQYSPDVSITAQKFLKNSMPPIQPDVSNTAPCVQYSPNRSSTALCVQYSPIVSITAHKVQKTSMCPIQPHLSNTAPIGQIQLCVSNTAPLCPLQPKKSKKEIDVSNTAPCVQCSPYRSNTALCVQYSPNVSNTAKK